MKRILFLFIVMLFLLGACGGGETQEVVKEPQTLEEYVAFIINKETGKEAEKSNGKERILNIVTIDDVIAGDGFKIVNIELNSDEHATVARTRDVMLLHSAKIFPELFNADGISEVSLNWNLPLVDVSGNESINTVMTITLRKDNNINWDNFDVYNFDKVADRYYEHKAIAQ